MQKDYSFSLISHRHAGGKVNGHQVCTHAKWKDVGTEADSAASFTISPKCFKPAYLMALGVTATVTGDRSSTEPSTPNRVHEKLERRVIGFEKRLFAAI